MNDRDVDGAGDSLVTILRTATPFEAQIIATRLRAAGIDAVVFDAITAGFGAAHGPGVLDVPLLVRRSDLAAACEELGLEVPAPGTATGDRVAVFQPPPETGFTERIERPPMPLLVRLSFLLSLAVLLIGLAGAIVTILL